MNRKGYQLRDNIIHKYGMDSYKHINTKITDGTVSTHIIEGLFIKPPYPYIKI